MKRITLGAVAAGLLLATTALPVQGAVHGVDWTATGVTLDHRVMELKWDGCLGCFFGRYTVTIIDPLDPLGPETATFFGSEAQMSVTNGPNGNAQLLLMVGQSLTPGYQLDFESRQLAGVNNAPHWITGTVIGTYQGVQFVLVIPPSPWQ